MNNYDQFFFVPDVFGVQLILEFRIKKNENYITI